MPVCEKCSEEFPNRVMVGGVTKNVSSRKYCLSCSPFGIHNTRKLNGDSRADQKQHSCSCGETDPNKFYGNKRSVCGKCHNKYTTESGRKKRLRAIELLGGKCVLCGYNRYYGSLSFHHTDPGLKDVHFSSLRGWSWERIRRELSSCVLLCQNCHGEVHGGFANLSLRVVKSGITHGLGP